MRITRFVPKIGQTNPIKGHLSHHPQTTTRQTQAKAGSGELYSLILSSFKFPDHAAINHHGDEEVCLRRPCGCCLRERRHGS